MDPPHEFKPYQMAPGIGVLVKYFFEEAVAKTDKIIDRHLKKLAKLTAEDDERMAIVIRDMNKAVAECLKEIYSLQKYVENTVTDPIAPLNVMTFYDIDDPVEGKSVVTCWMVGTIVHIRGDTEMYDLADC